MALTREKSVIKTPPLGYEVEKAYQWVDFQIYFKVRSHFFFFNDFIYGCAGSSCCLGFSLAAASRGCSPVGAAWASHRGGSSCCGAWALVPTDLFCGSRAREPRTSGCDAWAQLLCHVWSSQTRGGTRVPCFGRGTILYH